MGSLLVDEKDVTMLRDFVSSARTLLAALGGNYGDIDALAARMVLPKADGGPSGPTIYHQRKYSNRLGKSTKYTIASSGCLLCSVCSAEHDAGLDMDPVQFNDWMVANNGFLADNEGQVVNFIFSRPDKLGYLKFETLARYPNQPPTPAPVAKLDKYIADGGFIAIEVDFDPKKPGDQQHWCRYLGSGMIMDPWTGDIADVAQRYKPGLTAAEAIIAAAFYKRVK